MNDAPIDHAQAMPARPRRFDPGPSREMVAGRRFAPDKQALTEALRVVRRLDADSYRALLWALGLTPDARLSIPGCGSRPPEDEPTGRG